MKLGAVALLVTTFVVTGCGSQPSDDDASSRCEPVPRPTAQFLNDVLSPGMTLDDPVAVRMIEGHDVYIVAAKVGGQPALWVASPYDDGEGYVFSANDHAVAVSGVANPEPEPGAIVAKYDDAFAAALACLPVG